MPKHIRTKHVTATVVMADIGVPVQRSVAFYIVMAYLVMAYIVMADVAMVYIVMADVVMASVQWPVASYIAYIGMAYIPVAYGLHSHGRYSYGTSGAARRVRCAAHHSDFQAQHGGQSAPTGTFYI